LTFCDIICFEIYDVALRRENWSLVHILKGDYIFLFTKCILSNLSMTVLGSGEVISQQKEWVPATLGSQSTRPVEVE
jgi:hypothetical protein